MHMHAWVFSGIFGTYATFKTISMGGGWPNHFHMFHNYFSFSYMHLSLLFPVNCWRLLFSFCLTFTFLFLHVFCLILTLQQSLVFLVVARIFKWKFSQFSASEIDRVGEGARRPNERTNETQWKISLPPNSSVSFDTNTLTERSSAPKRRAKRRPRPLLLSPPLPLLLLLRLLARLLASCYTHDEHRDTRTHTWTAILHPSVAVVDVRQLRS